MDRAPEVLETIANPDQRHTFVNLLATDLCSQHVLIEALKNCQRLMEAPGVQVHQSCQFPGALRCSTNLTNLFGRKPARQVIE
jgi:hypothetical protein